MKKITISLLTILSILGTNCAMAFTDIAPEDPHAHEYNHLREVGIMGAYEDGGFHPEKIVTRAEALTIALRSGGIAIPKDPDFGLLIFSDVDPNSWYTPAILRAVELEMISRSDKFRPNEAITKAEFLSLLFRATQVNYRPFLNSKAGVADDISEEDWFALAFAYAKKYQVAHLPADNLYRPYKNLSRMEVALMTFRQLRLFHGDNATKSFLELQAKIQQFMTLLRGGKSEEAQAHLPRILELTDTLTLQKNNENAVAAQALSNSLKYLINSIRAFKFGNKIDGLEQLFLASRYANRTAEKSENLAPFARDVHDIITTTLRDISPLSR